MTTIITGGNEVNEETNDKPTVNTTFTRNNNILHVQDGTVNSNGNWINDEKDEVDEETSGKNITLTLFYSNNVILFEQDDTVTHE